jgi:hypothetical protein
MKEEGGEYVIYHKQQVRSSEDKKLKVSLYLSL